MFSKNKNSQYAVSGDANSKTATVIAEDVTIKDGNLSGGGGRGGVTVSGVLFSNIDIEGVLIVTKNGVLQGDVIADSAYVHGAVEGNVSVKGQVHVYSEGKILGDVLCASFMVEEGATFKGHCSNTVAQSAKLLDIKGAAIDQKAASTANGSEPSK